WWGARLPWGTPYPPGLPVTPARRRPRAAGAGVEAGEADRAGRDERRDSVPGDARAVAPVMNLSGRRSQTGRQRRPPRPGPRRKGAVVFRTRDVVVGAAITAAAALAAITAASHRPDPTQQLRRDRDAVQAAANRLTYETISDAWTQAKRA